MIAIDNVIIGDEVVSAQFVCDLSSCKGACCEEGDAGAPLAENELDEINAHYEIVQSYITPEGVDTIEKKGKYELHKTFGWVTPTIEGSMCAYGFKDEAGIIKCAFEQAFYDGKTTWKKPISCHLYPIKIKTTKQYDLVNYEPRDKLCNPACALGEKLKIPVYVFLKEALVRKYGMEFYTVLEQAATQYFEKKG